MARDPSYNQTTWSWKGPRAWIAAGVLVLLIVVTSISSLSGHLRVCEGKDGEPYTCRSLNLLDPPVMLTALLALGLLLPDVRRVRIGPDGLDLELKDTVGEGENLGERIGVLERKVSLYEDSGRAGGEVDGEAGKQ